MSGPETSQEHAAVAEAPHGAHDNPRRRYVIIWAILLVFTLIEVGASVLVPHELRAVLIGTLLVFMLAKACLVGAFFMHLITEKRALRSVIVLPGTLLAIYAVVLIREALARW